MKHLIVVIMLLAIASCSHWHANRSDCDAYYKMIRSNWQKDDKGVHSFKGLDYPSGWERVNYQKYFNEDCLMKLPKKQIIKLFGQPTKTYYSPKRDLYVYCMTSSCLDIELYGNVALYLDFTNGVVSGVFTSPGPEY